MGKPRQYRNIVLPWPLTTMLRSMLSHYRWEDCMKKANSPCVVLLFLMIPTASYAQTTSQPNEGVVLQTLLSEVRLLRQTLQTVQLYTLRAQIAIERLRTQQDGVTRLTNAIESLHGEIRSNELQMSA